MDIPQKGLINGMKTALVCRRPGADKECLTFGALIDKNWRSPVAIAA
jgi:hypothetical protein